MTTAASHPLISAATRAQARSTKFRASLLAASSAAALVLGVPAAHAQNATWTGQADINANPAATSGTFTNPGDWNGNTVPTGTATFNTSQVNNITMSGGGTTIGEFLFNSGASAFTFSGQTGVLFNGAGIVNNSNNTQTYNNGVANILFFSNTASAGNSPSVNITNQGTIQFNMQSTGGSATITNGSGTNSGTITFSGTSTGGNAAFTNNTAGSTIDFSQSTGPNANKQLSAGSIAGAGTFSLGANTLTVGSDNTSTTVSGVIADGGAGGGTGGSLVKTGTGTLTLTGMNTYTGTTTIMQGVLLLNGSLHMSDTTVAGGIARRLRHGPEPHRE